MGIRMNKNKGKQPVLVLEGDVDISIAADIKTRIMDVMNETDSLTVDLGGVERLDISCVQLLCAANRSFEKKSKRLNVITGKGDSLCRTLLGSSGYDAHDGCPEKKCRACLWKKGDRNDG